MIAIKDEFRNSTYSEAMLISGASKQISCAILYYFVFFEFKLISLRKVHVYMP